MIMLWKPGTYSDRSCHSFNASSDMTRVSQQDIEYVDVRSGPGPGRREPASFYDKWVDQCSSSLGLVRSLALTGT